MSDEWYSSRRPSRFSLEHRAKCPSVATMIDLDQILWLPYVSGGHPAMVCELKPENAREDFWTVTRQLARRANIPAAKIIEQTNGLYTVWVMEPSDRTLRHIGSDMTIQDWYEKVELPFRRAS